MNERPTLKSGLPAALASELDRLVGALVPAADGARYRLERILGRGALYVTFRATRISKRGAVPHAVKVLRPSLARAWPTGARLLSREQERVLAILDERVPPSPHVLRLKELGELAADPARGVDEPVPWLALELIDPERTGPEAGRGASLFDRVRASIAATGGGLDPASAETILRGVALGLDWVHQHGLLHRGLSPTNVLVAGVRDEAIAKIADVAIARPAELPAKFGVELQTSANLGSAPYRAPELDDPDAVLTPACDVFALGALARFVFTGRGPVDGDVALATEASLHPAARTPAALEDLEAAIACCTAKDPGDRPPTAHSAWWDRLGPPLRALAASSDGFLARAAAARTSVAPAPPASSWVWTERHHPESRLSITAIATDAEGHALALDDGRLTYFDGSSFRPPETSSLHAIHGVIRLAPGAFVAYGRGPNGARASRIDAEGWLPIVDRAADAFVAAFAHEGMLHLVAKRGAVLSLVTGTHDLVLEGARVVHAVAPLDDRAIVIVGETTAGAAYVATFDPRTAMLRPQPPPAPGRLAVAAGALGDAWIGGPHGTVVLARRVLESVARLRTAREQVPTHEDVCAIAVAPDGTPWCATRSALHHRESGAWRTVFDEPSIGRVVAIAPRATGVVVFSETGVVLEGRALGG
jgi:serine/threonine protein kinase